MYSGTVRYMIWIIIAVILLFVSYSFAGKIAERTNEAIIASKCEQSVISHIKTLSLSKSFETGTPTRESPINCPRINITLNQNEEEELKYALADKMKSCWKMWQRGQKELFLERGVYCQPCYLVDFKHKDIKINDFEEFLINTTVPLQNYTYAKYLSSQTNNPEFSTKAIMANPIINYTKTNFTTNNRKVILFYYNKDYDTVKAYFDKLKAQGIGVGIGTIVGGVLVGSSTGISCAIAIIGTGGIASVPCASILIGLVGGGIAGGVIGGFVSGVNSGGYPLWISYIMIKDYNKEEMENLGCEIAPGTQTNIYQNNLLNT